MYPPQTSFIPVQIALARFLENQGWRAIFAHYPYWYLGTTPFRYLTGPILPTLMVVVHRLLPGLDWFMIFYLILGMVWPLGGVGVFWLVRVLTKSRQGLHFKGIVMAALVAALFTFGPVVPFFFRFSNGLSLLSVSFLPYVLVAYVNYLRKRARKNKQILITLISFLLLLDISIFSILFLGMTAVFLTLIGWKRAEKKIKSSLKVLLYSLLLVTLWYGPGYWWQILLAPSFAGKSLLSVVSQVGKLLPIALAISLAVVSGRFFEKKKNTDNTLILISRFSFYWLFIFGFLTLIRFISDPDFWLDWSSYGTELQLGLAIAGGVLLDKLRSITKIGSFKLIKITFLVVAFTLSLSIFSLIFNQRVLKVMQNDIEASVEYRIGKWLEDNVGGQDKVFLSGSTVFWLNAFFDACQVRGGNDGPSVDSRWREAAWEIREGNDIEKSIVWLEELGVKYLVVHTSVSKEYWHDFKNPDKFENNPRLEKIYDQEGDRIYLTR